MRRMTVVAVLMCLTIVPRAFGQDWQEFRSREDGFGVNFPGAPAVTEIRWISEYGADIPARVYEAKSGRSTYAVTVVDYNLVKNALIEKAKTCQERCPAADSYSGAGHWKDDLRGAMIFAEFKVLQRDAKLAHFMWNYLGGTGVESNQMQLVNNADQSRTFANFYMHENRLYILEATTPANGFLPNIFTESIAIQGLHEGVYNNRSRIDPFEKLIMSRSNPGHVRPNGWTTYTSTADLFTVDLPGQPQVTSVPWESEQGVYLPAYSHTVKNGASTYSVTVVNYSWAQQLHSARVDERCARDLNDERCTGDTSWSGKGYWKNDIRGAMVFTASKLMQRNAKLTRFKWNYLPQGIETNELELVNNADKSRTVVVTAMHLNRLYILEATTPGDQPLPTGFTGSASLLNVEGIRAFHEGVYINGTRIEPNEINAKLTGIFLQMIPPTPPANAQGAGATR